MSLFGGFAPPSRASYESDTSVSSSPRSSPPVVEVPAPHSTQEAQKLDIPIPLDVDDDLDTETEEEEEEEEEDQHVRPNKFKGDPNVWLDYTEADRQIAESLQQLEDSDLSVHLYNAHAHKRRQRRPAEELAQLKNWQGRDAWQKSKKDLKFVDAAGREQHALVIPNSWTAWPHSPSPPPDHDERLDSALVGDQPDEWAIESGSKEDAGQELREELLAVHLRIAKDSWRSWYLPSGYGGDARIAPGWSRAETTKSSRSRARSRTGVMMDGYSDADGKRSNTKRIVKIGKYRLYRETFLKLVQLMIMKPTKYGIGEKNQFELLKRLSRNPTKYGMSMRTYFKLLRKLNKRPTRYGMDRKAYFKLLKLLVTNPPSYGMDTAVYFKVLRTLSTNPRYFGIDRKVYSEVMKLLITNPTRYGMGTKTYFKLLEILNRNPRAYGLNPDKYFRLLETLMENPKRYEMDTQTYLELLGRFNRNPIGYGMKPFRYFELLVRIITNPERDEMDTRTYLELLERVYRNPEEYHINRKTYFGFLKTLERNHEKFGIDAKAWDEFERKLRRVEHYRQISKREVLADDSEAQQLLQPSIQSIMSRLDELALSLRRTRFNHFDHDKPVKSFGSAAESSGPASRSASRARPSKSASRKPSTRPSSRASSIRASSAIRKGMEEIVQMGAADYDAASDGASDWEASNKEPQQQKTRRSSGVVSDSDASTIQDKEMREGLMDWSEVLGLAAVKGWNSGAIARTAQRCADLFGESMSFIPLDEASASKSTPEPVLYTPSTIPAPSIPLATEGATQKRPFFPPATLNCPHTDCWGYEKQFAAPFRVVEHCLRVHKYDPRTNDYDNEERMVGGVHIDGFLQPVLAQNGQKGKGPAQMRTIGKKQTKSRSRSRAASEATVNDEE